jgi:hypothetical protein
MGDVVMSEEQNTVGSEDATAVDEALEEWKARTGIPNEFVVPGESKSRSTLGLRALGGTPGGAPHGSRGPSSGPSRRP